MPLYPPIELENQPNQQRKYVLKIIRMISLLEMDDHGNDLDIDRVSFIYNRYGSSNTKAHQGLQADPPSL